MVLLMERLCFIMGLFCYVLFEWVGFFLWVIVKMVFIVDKYILFSLEFGWNIVEI